MATLGLFLFSSNYFVFYLATFELTTGLIAIVFSGIVVTNIIFGALFLGNPVRPRVVLGAGFGIANVDLQIDNITGVLVDESGDDTVFAYQAALGVAFKMNETATIELSYRYFATAEPDINDTEMEYATSNVMLGFRMYF